MVTVYFGYDKKAIINPDVHFRHTFRPEWMKDPFVKQMVKDIDDCIVEDSY